EIPELRIVEDALWQAVKDRQVELAVKYAKVIDATRAAHANRLNQTHRPRALLSGLIFCGRCGGTYALRGQDRYACSNHVMNGSCANSRTIARTALEDRVLTGLRDRLMAPEVAAEAMRAYVEETNRLNRERRAASTADRKALTEVEKRIAEIVAAIEDGGYTRTMTDHLRKLEAEQDTLTERLSSASTDTPDIHPNVSHVYRRKVERLAEALRSPEERDEAAAAIRDIVERITLTPGPKRGQVDATLHGDLGTILDWAAGKKGQKHKTDTSLSGVSVSVVAGAGF
ncbi:MAG TPA: recombinase family protein, partial [Kiloniellaceae bacterium]|nr:recombinase family protein [Kiloniellaceae bacterium]